MPDEKIDKALKQIGEGLIQVYLRGGKIVKILKGEVRRPIRDKIQDVTIIHEDIEIE